jgi:hypothetical protein
MLTMGKSFLVVLTLPVFNPPSVANCRRQGDLLKDMIVYKRKYSHTIQMLIIIPDRMTYNSIMLRL